MKAKIIFYEQDEDECKRNESLGFPAPEPKQVESIIYFRPEDIGVSYINADNDIALHMAYGTWVVEYDKDLWEKIKTLLGD